MSAALDALPAETGKFVYVGSTGVYGQSRGEWVNELSPCDPTRAGGRACLAAEQQLAAHPLGRRAIILRMAGLYGPGRIPLAAELRRAEPLAVPRDGYLNLIHIDDAAAVVLAADERAVSPRTYVVSDGASVQRQAYYTALAELLGRTAATFRARGGRFSGRVARRFRQTRAQYAAAGRTGGNAPLSLLS